MSRANDIELVEVPKGEEVRDDLAQNVLSDPAQEALEQARAERQKEREQQKVIRQEQRATQEEAERQREVLAQRRREAKEAEDRKKREEIARIDDERRKARAEALEAREREKEEEKRKFGEAKAAEMEKERARVQALMEERQRALSNADATAEPPARSGSRPRSRRPPSRPTSGLRGTIPEQPPDVEAGQIKDVMADEPPTNPRGAGSHAVGRRRGNTPLRGAATADAGTVAAQRKAPTPAAKAPTPRAPAANSPPTARTGYTPQSVPASNAQLNPEKDADANYVQTLVVLEKMRAGNSAVTYEGDTITWSNYPITVTEIKERKEDDFNYRSEVVHRLCDYASKGFNVAVLSAEAPNTVARAQSPVWPVLLRIVETVLRSKRDRDGNLKSSFLFECALAYFDGTNAKDLLVDGQPFRTLTVKPSPVSGPRLSDMTYISVTDGHEFEDCLTSALSRAANDAVIASRTTGFIGAYLTVREEFVENGKRDVCFSSINVMSAGSDMTPYDDALSRNRGPYGSLLHLDILGPCFTCFMFNLADDDAVQRSPLPQDSNVHNELVTTYRILERMSKTKNLPLRSGSVRRFVHYVRKNQTEVKQRLAADDGAMAPDKRAKLEKYLVESEAIYQQYSAMLGEGSGDP